MEVLISAPSGQRDPTYLPYIHGVLKTYVQRDPTLADRVNWRPPVYRRAELETLEKDRSWRGIDVLGLSCRTWNWSLQRRIARRLKAKNPDCLVVAGGPHCDYTDPDFFLENPFIDVVVLQEGEEPFRRLLRQRRRDRVDWGSIPGLCWPDENGEPRLSDPPERLDLESLPDVSPYRAQSADYRPILDQIRSRGHAAAAAFESNRGCPYGCVYCDWGALSGAHSVRTMPRGRIHGDLEWLTEHGLSTLYLTDANVGMLDRDRDIIDRLCRLKKRRGAPESFIWNFTKTGFEGIEPIAERLNEVGLLTGGGISLFVQHTNPRVIEAIDRKNPPEDTLRKIVQYNRKNGCIHSVQLILGCPGDTYTAWKECLTGFMERGIHGEYWVKSFNLLPNSPAAASDYREQWDIETTTTRNLTKVDITDETHMPGLAHKELVTGTRTFDPEDWCRMWVFTYLVKAFHSMGLTRMTALYLRWVEGVSFNDFYAALADDLCAGESTGTLSRLYRRMLEAKRAFVAGEDQPLDRTRLSELPNYDYWLKWREWLFVKIVLNRRDVYRQLEAFVVERFPVQEDPFGELLRFQSFCLLTSEYDPEPGKALTVSRDWVEYFGRDREGYRRPPRRRPCRLRIDATSLESDDLEVPITWHEQTGQRRLRSWFEAVVRHPFGTMDRLTVRLPRRVSRKSGG